MLPADALMRRAYGTDQDDPNPSSPWGTNTGNWSVAHWMTCSWTDRVER